MNHIEKEIYYLHRCQELSKHCSEVVADLKAHGIEVHFDDPLHYFELEIRNWCRSIERMA